MVTKHNQLERQPKQQHERQALGSCGTFALLLLDRRFQSAHGADRTTVSAMSGEESHGSARRRIAHYVSFLFSTSPRCPSHEKVWKDMEEKTSNFHFHVHVLFLRFPIRLVCQQGMHLVCSISSGQSHDFLCGVQENLIEVDATTHSLRMSPAAQFDKTVKELVRLFFDTSLQSSSFSLDESHVVCKTLSSNGGDDLHRLEQTAARACFFAVGYAHGSRATGM